MDMRSRIIPVPREYEPLGFATVILGYPGKACFSISNETDTASSAVLESADRLLKDTLRGLLNVDPDVSDGEVKITLRLGEAPENVRNADQGYRINIGGGSVTVTGFGETGLYYGVVTLTKCTAPCGGPIELEACRIIDWPDLRTRGHFMESRFGSNLMTLDDWKDVVDHMASMKQNQLVISFNKLFGFGIFCIFCVKF